MKQFTLRIPNDLAEAVKSLSEKKEMTQTQIIREAIKEHLRGENRLNQKSKY